MITASAPMKLHLIGEHSVVYGEPAIMAAIDKRVTVVVEESERIRVFDEEFGENFDFSVEEVLSFTKNARKLWKECNEKKDFTEIIELASDSEGFKKASIGEALLQLGINRGVTINVKRDVPAFGGLGASAAYAVSLPMALAKMNGEEITKERANEIGFEIERFSHANPSGGDNSTCCFGGFIWFQKSSSGNAITSLKEEIPYDLKNFVFVNSGKPKKSRGEIIQGVRDLDENYRIQRVKALGDATRKMRYALKNHDLESMKELMNFAQKNLSELGVSTENIDRITEKVRKIGGAAKLCGAGGGGAVLCFHHNKEQLKDVIKDLDYDFWDATLGVEGVKIENL